ncbi:type II CAAX endopeptidase family protein [Fructilactobacillus fructivorans]|nr:type II CAAX endopeptidase family protein [Fructilactobacillus fructivorans]
MNLINFLKRAVIFIGLILLIFAVQIPVQLIGIKNYHGIKAFLWGAFYLALFLVIIGLAFWAYRSVYRQHSHKITFHDLKIILMAILSFFIIEIVLQFFNKLIFNQVGTKNNNAILSLFQSNTTVLVLMSISAVFLSPVLEELVFRGFFINAFFNQNAFWLPIVLSGLLFSCGHMSSNVISFMIYAILGIILAYVYKKTGKIEVSIGVHFLNNLIATGFMLLAVL